MALRAVHNHSPDFTRTTSRNRSNRPKEFHSLNNTIPARLLHKLSPAVQNQRAVTTAHRFSARLIRNKKLTSAHINLHKSTEFYSRKNATREEFTKNPNPGDTHEFKTQLGPVKNTIPGPAKNFTKHPGPEADRKYART